MKFTRKNRITSLTEGREYKGTISSIQPIECKSRNYYEIGVDLEDSTISIWVNDEINPEHPLFELFDALIENEEDAEGFDEQEIVGYEIVFTVKNFTINGKKGEFIRTFFDKVTPVFEEEEDE